MANVKGAGGIFYSTLLFAPFGFWILGVIFAKKALKTRDLGLLKKEIREMFYYQST